MSDRISQANFKKHVKKIHLPKGFTASMEMEGFNANTLQMVYVLKSDTIELRFDQSGSGHTLFLKDGSWLSFDRLGVEDSFYHLPTWKGDSHTYDLNQIVTEQLERVAEYLAIKFIQIPGLPFSRTAEQIKRLKENLMRQGQVSLMPAGFGMGYTLSRSAKAGHSGVKRAPAELEKFFGTDPLYISTFDAD